MKLKTIRQIKKLNNQAVLLRVDFNCPVKNGKIIDDRRIIRVLPTIKYLIKKRAKIILISHFGRPKGRKNKKYSLRPVYNNLKLKIKDLKFINDCIGEKVKRAINRMKPGDVILLENLRFYPQEEKNDRKFAKKLANLANVYINDAFSTCHRKNSSISSITKYLPSYAGFLIEKEVSNLSEILKKPKSPFVVIMGGIKISTKIATIKNLTKIADKVLIGGAIFSNFLKAQNYNIGKSIYEPTMIKVAKGLLKNKKIVLPVDLEIEEETKKHKSKIKITELNKMNRKTFRILDIGPETIQLFSNYIKSAKMIVWNGPMGYFEKKPFDNGTKKIMEFILQNKKAKIVIGGGETASIFPKKIASNIFISTGGGAMLKFLSGKILPGIKSLINK